MSLEEMFKDHKIFIDTCSLLHEEFSNIQPYISSLLEKYDNQMIIPKRVLDELNNKTQVNDQTLANRAKKAKYYLKIMQQKGQLDIRGEETDNFADNVFLSVFTQHRLKHNLLLITQDKALSEDLLNLNYSKSVQSKFKISILYINRAGGLSLSQIGKYSSPQANVTSKNQIQDKDDDFSPREKERVNDQEKFKLGTNLTTIQNRPLSVSYLPSEGELVYTSKGPIRLLNTLASGGEGTVYTTETPYVCKIYKKEKLDLLKYEKIKLMISKKIDCPGVCWPVEMVLNKNKEFVGYLMSKAAGKELQKCLFIKPLFQKAFPKWKKRDLVQLCITVLEKIQFLHERNIILGDINPNNILVVDAQTVYLVDTDSYQIEGFPCPVGTINFTAPEIQRKNYSTFLRTFGHEYFAVATLLFMMLLPGKPPYSQQGGQNMIDNVIGMDFSYPLGKDKNNKVPDGSWRFMWSHLPYQLKEAFFKTFKKGEAFSEENTRFTTQEWLDKLKWYLKLLDDGILTANDEMSNDLFPTRFKRYKKDDDENDIFERRCCSVCGSSFEITVGESQFYNSKGMELPKKCRPCRKNANGYQNYTSAASSTSSSYTSQSNSRPSSHQQSTGSTYSYTKQTLHSNSTSYQQPKTSYTPPKQTAAKKSGFCYITTAVCDFFNKPDDCYELTMFRKFRDEYLAIQLDGLEVIKRYYDLAPLIVKQINESLYQDDIYYWIWETYLQPCLHYIENGQNEECRLLYTNMVTKLEQSFIKN